MTHHRGMLQVFTVITETHPQSRRNLGWLGDWSEQPFLKVNTGGGGREGGRRLELFSKLGFRCRSSRGVSLHMGLYLKMPNSRAAVFLDVVKCNI